MRRKLLLLSTLVALAVALTIGVETALAGNAAPQQATLTVAEVGTGTGLVTSDPAGISCGAVCSANFVVGTSLVLTEQPAPGARFAGYSENCTPVAPHTSEPDKLPRPLPWCRVTLDSPDTSVQATFKFIPPCVVPSVRGMRVYYAKRRLWSGHCRAGWISHAFSRRIRKGRVISQEPRAGSQFEHGAKVYLVVSKGRR